MDTIDNYREFIIENASPLIEKGFSYIGEDDYSIKFTDGTVFLTFIVAPGEEFLEVWVEFLSDQFPDDEKYRLDLIMEVYYKRDVSPLFIASTDIEKEQMVKNYINFIVNHKEELFGEQFPLTNEYRKFNQQAGQKLFDEMLNSDFQ